MIDFLYLFRFACETIFDGHRYVQGVGDTKKKAKTNSADLTLKSVLGITEEKVSEMKCTQLNLKIVAHIGLDQYNISNYQWILAYFVFSFFFCKKVIKKNCVI